MTNWILVCTLATAAVASEHADHAMEHPPTPATAPQADGFGTMRSALSTSGPTREVHAYLPYWELDFDAFRWGSMTTLAFFAADMDANGDLGALNGWTGATSAGLRDEAHANGVRYILTITNFSSAAIEALVNDPARRAHAIEGLLTQVQGMGGDGVNIDFEGVPKAAKQGLVAFVTETTEAFHAAIPGGYVTVATPAVDWSGAFDYDVLAAGSDGLMIMGYGYHWKGSDPGPISPTASGATWGEKNLRWTLEDYFQWGLAENRAKFLLGLPFYGRDWVSDGPQIPGKALSDGTAVVYAQCEKVAAAHGGFQWDAASLTSYVIYQEGGAWHQLWCDDGPSWAAKMALVEEFDIGGVGIWALGYEGATTALWDAIEETLLPPDGGTTGGTDGGTTGGTDGGTTDPDGGTTGGTDGGPVDPDGGTTGGTDAGPLDPDGGTTGGTTGGSTDPDGGAAGGTADAQGGGTTGTGGTTTTGGGTTGGTTDAGAMGGGDALEPGTTGTGGTTGAVPSTGPVTEQVAGGTAGTGSAGCTAGTPGAQGGAGALLILLGLLGAFGRRRRIA